MDGRWWIARGADGAGAGQKKRVVPREAGWLASGSGDHRAPALLRTDDGWVCVSRVTPGILNEGGGYSWPIGPSPTGWHGPGPKKHGPNPVRPVTDRASAVPVPGLGPCLGRNLGPRH